MEGLDTIAPEGGTSCIVTAKPEQPALKMSDHSSAYDLPAAGQTLASLGLSPELCRYFQCVGYETVEDIAKLSTSTILRMPHGGAEDWQKLASALGREAVVVRVRPVKIRRNI